MTHGATTPTSVVIPFIKGHTENHQDYLDSIRDNLITICIGPAGTGKTYMSVGSAAIMLKNGQCKRIVITRPMVECGNKMGFLPGDVLEKAAPWMIPILDVFEEFFGREKTREYIEQEIIEIVPLEMMRGRSLKGSVIISDEMQNADKKQLKMLITRLGKGSKLIINGDCSQCDLVGYTEDTCPLGRLYDIFDGRLSRLGVVEMDKHDIMRHEFLKEIVDILDDEF